MAEIKRILSQSQTIKTVAGDNVGGGIVMTPMPNTVDGDTVCADGGTVDFSTQWVSADYYTSDLLYEGDTYAYVASYDGDYLWLHGGLFDINNPVIADARANIPCNDVTWNVDISGDTTNIKFFYHIVGGLVCNMFAHATTTTETLTAVFTPTVCGIELPPLTLNISF